MTGMSRVSPRRRHTTDGFVAEADASGHRYRTLEIGKADAGSAAKQSEDMQSFTLGCSRMDLTSDEERGS
jgi:hypothetical protein